MKPVEMYLSELEKEKGEFLDSFRDTSRKCLIAVGNHIEKFVSHFSGDQGATWRSNLWAYAARLTIFKPQNLELWYKHILYQAASAMPKVCLCLLLSWAEKFLVERYNCIISYLLFFL